MSYQDDIRYYLHTIAEELMNDEYATDEAEDAHKLLAQVALALADCPAPFNVPGMIVKWNP